VARLGPPKVRALGRPVVGGAVVRYLHCASADETARAWRQPTFDLLGVQPGQAILDLACRDGDDARALAALVGQAGLVVGLDSSQTTIVQARRRSVGATGRLEFRVGDAERLEFDDDTFDGCRADRLLGGLAEPARAIAEMARVARRGAWIVVSEPDWAWLLRDAPDRDLAGRILGRAAAADWEGRLRRLLRGCRLRDVTSLRITVPLAAFYPLAARLGLLDLVEAAQRSGAISAREAAVWLDSLEWAARADRVFGTLTALVAAGQKR
jgi:SAM-dependent methyltransferase